MKLACIIVKKVFIVGNIIGVFMKMFYATDDT